MFISRADDSWSCKKFAGTLKNVAHKWIVSIVNFDDLCTKFVAQIATNSEKSFMVADLFDVQLRTTESLKSYLTRFNSTTLKVVEPNEEIFIMAFKKGLHTEDVNNE